MCMVDSQNVQYLYIVPRIHKSKREPSVEYAGVLLWNGLSEIIKICSYFLSFISKFEQYLFDLL